MAKHSKAMEKDLLALSNERGISGHEGRVATLVKSKLQKVPGLKFEKDNLGSLAVIKKGTGGVKVPTISFVAHMDEVGFMITQITPKGFIKFTPIGGWWGHVLLGQQLEIETRKGEFITGIVGATPPHILTPEQARKVLQPKQMYIDLGVSSDKEVAKLGIKIGDPITPKSTSWVMPNGDFVSGKALDDRAGTAIGIEVIRKLSKVKHEANVIFVNSVQEEVGLRGAKTSTWKWTPDVSFAVDVTISNDQPGMEEKPTKMGSGVALSMFDYSIIGNPKLRAEMEKLATKAKIPFTLDGLTGGGTDAGAIHLTKDGVVTMTLSVPTRYMHSHNTIVSLSDMQATVDLLVDFIVKLNKTVLNRLKK